MKKRKNNKKRRMRRNPHRKKNRFNFMVKTRGLSCRQAIAKKIEQQEKTEDGQQKKVEPQDKIIMKKSSRPKLRMYFACSRDVWRKFYHEIKALCVTESPVLCSCPRWLQKKANKELTYDCTQQCGQSGSCQ